MSTKHTLPRTLQQLLEARQHNSHSLAMASGIPQPVIYRILHGHTQNPKVDTLMAMASSLDVSLEQLLGVTPWQDAQPDLTWIPMLTHDTLHQWQQAHTVTDTWLPSNTPNTPAPCFATTLWDDTMAPGFAEGGNIIINPQRQAKHRDHVLVQTKQTYLFRQYLSDQHHRLLKAMHSDFPATPMQAHDHIIGVAIEYRRCL